MKKSKKKNISAKKDKEKNTQVKCFSLPQINRLREAIQKEKKKFSVKAGKRKERLAMLEWFTVELGLHSGLRVSEMAKLKIRHLIADIPRIAVIDGKGGKDRKIVLSKDFVLIYSEFLHWKVNRGDPTDAGAYLFYNADTGKPFTTRTLQNCFRRAIQKAKLPSHFTTHSMRHTFAHYLHKASGDVRLVQQMLGHESLEATQEYLDSLAFENDLEPILSRMYTPSQKSSPYSSLGYPHPNVPGFPAS